MDNAAQGKPVYKRILLKPSWATMLSASTARCFST